MFSLISKRKPKKLFVSSIRKIVNSHYSAVLKVLNAQYSLSIEKKKAGRAVFYPILITKLQTGFAYQEESQSKQLLSWTTHCRIE